MRKMKAVLKNQKVAIFAMVVALGLCSGCGKSEEGTQETTVTSEAGDATSTETTTETKEEVAQESSSNIVFQTMEVADGVAISGYEGTGDVLVIPDEIDGKAVVEIDTMAFMGSTFKEITIPDSVKVLRAACFTSNYKLEKIDLGNGIEIIEELCFIDCPLLTVITIPNSVTSMEGTQFGNNTNLEEIYIPESVTTIGTNEGFLGIDTCPKAVVITPAGSAAEKVMQEQGIPCENE